MSAIHDMAYKFLDEDERIIYPWMYKDSPWMYDCVRGTIYLIRFLNRSEIIYDWVRPSGLDRLMNGDIPEVTIISEMLLVRIRDPKKNRGWFLSEEEYRENQDDYIVLDVLAIVSDDRYYPKRVKNMSIEQYQAVAGEYDLLDTCYLVTTAYKGKKRK